MNQPMNSEESARSRKVRAKELLRGLNRRKSDEFLAVTCKSCDRPFRTDMDATSVKTFENLFLEGNMRFTYGCPYCNKGNSYNMLEHYWGASGPPVERPTLE